MATAIDKKNGNWIKRGQVARLLGTSYGSVRRLEGKRLFPTRDDRGTCWFLESEVRELARHMQPTTVAKKLPETCDDETAAQAFDKYDAGENPADVVRSLRIHPNVARSLHRDWADLRALFVVSGEAAAKLSRLPCMTWSYPVSNADELLEVLESASIEQCRACNDRDAQICTMCALRNRDGVAQFVKAEQMRAEELSRRAHERKVRAQAARIAAENAKAGVRSQA